MITMTVYVNDKIMIFFFLSQLTEKKIKHTIILLHGGVAHDE